MFYSTLMLSRKGALGNIWLAAHWDKKLSKHQIVHTSIDRSVDNIMKPEEKLALRLSGHLLLGLARIFSRKVKYLYVDCRDAIVKIKLAFRPAEVDMQQPAAAGGAATTLTTRKDQVDEFEISFQAQEDEGFGLGFDAGDGDLFGGAGAVTAVDSHSLAKTGSSLQDDEFGTAVEAMDDDNDDDFFHSAPRSSRHSMAPEVLRRGDSTPGSSKPGSIAGSGNELGADPALEPAGSSKHSGEARRESGAGLVVDGGAADPFAVGEDEFAGFGGDGFDDEGGFDDAGDLGDLGLGADFGTPEVKLGDDEARSVVDSISDRSAAGSHASSHLATAAELPSVEQPAAAGKAAAGKKRRERPAAVHDVRCTIGSKVMTAWLSTPQETVGERAQGAKRLRRTRLATRRHASGRLAAAAAAHAGAGSMEALLRASAPAALPGNRRARERSEQRSNPLVRAEAAKVTPAQAAALKQRAAAALARRKAFFQRLAEHLGATHVDVDEQDDAASVGPDGADVVQVADPFAAGEDEFAGFGGDGFDDEGGFDDAGGLGIDLDLGGQLDEAGALVDGAAGAASPAQPEEVAVEEEGGAEEEDDELAQALSATGTSLSASAVAASAAAEGAEEADGVVDEDGAIDMQRAHPRTRGILKMLHRRMGPGGEEVSFGELAAGHTRRTVAALFHELLVLKTWGIVGAKQAEAYADIEVSTTDRTAAAVRAC